MFDSLKSHVTDELAQIRDGGLTKRERVLGSPQGARVAVAGPSPFPGPLPSREGGSVEVLNFCANNYLGLANDPRLVAAAKAALDRWGFGLSSVRFICGTQQLHTQLEERIARFVGAESAILYGSCFDANGGLFETLLGEEDAVISDELNHASIIDGVRLCKARRLRYRNRDMADLEAKLTEAASARCRLIATDGVFSMDGTIAPLADICELADRHDAAVMVDDSHATGFMGPSGRGTPEHHGVVGQVDILTSTFGKALGGASGGFTAARAEIVELLRQRSRPYLFSNTLAPPIAAATLAALDIVEGSGELRERLWANTRHFRAAMADAGFQLAPTEHPIVPIMLGAASAATRLADALLADGIYVIGFSYPVVPKGAARIRVQISAAHSRDDLDRAVAAFARHRERA